MLLDGDPRSPFRVLRGTLESRSSMMILDDDRSHSELVRSNFARKSVLQRKEVPVLLYVPR